MKPTDRSAIGNGCVITLNKREIKQQENQLINQPFEDLPAENTHLRSFQSTAQVGNHLGQKTPPMNEILLNNNIFFETYSPPLPDPQGASSHSWRPTWGNGFVACNMKSAELHIPEPKEKKFKFEDWRSYGEQTRCIH